MIKEGDCIDCWYYYGISTVTCHNEYTKQSDLDNGGCIFFEPKWDPPGKTPQDVYDQYQKEWN